MTLSLRYFANLIKESVMKKIMTLSPKTVPIPLLFCTAFFMMTTCQAAVTPMTEEQLDTETAKGFSATISPTGSIDFAVDQPTKSGIPVSANGTLDVLQKTDPLNHANFLSLNDSAQQNLRALISVNAVDSDVQVLMNMTVNIDSNVGVIEQANQALHNQELLTR